ncbi:MAG: DUF6427 family protein [Weeksellaceae bacterium]
MLAKFLAQKSFLPEFVLGCLFLVLFYLKNSPFYSDWEVISTVILFLVNLAVCRQYFNFSPLTEITGVALWYFLPWVFVFSGILTDVKITASLLVSSLLLWSVLAYDSNPENRWILFFIGVFSGINAVLFPPTVLLIGFLLLMFIFLKGLSLRSFILFLIGLLLLPLVGIQILYILDKMDWIKIYDNAFFLDYWDAPAVWGLLPVGFMLLIAWLDHLLQFRVQSIYKRHQYFLIFTYFVNWVVILALFAGEKLDMLIFLGLPLTVFLTRFVHHLKSKSLKEIFLWSYLVCMVGFYFREEITAVYLDLLGNVSF